VIEVDLNLDVTGRDLRGAQVQHGMAMVGADLELARGGPVAEPLGHRVVGGDPDRRGGSGLREVHHVVLPRSGQRWLRSIPSIHY
jgi:hypothetical protein